MAADPTVVTSFRIVILDRVAASEISAAYLELAHRRTLALACKGGSLRKAAKRAGVALWSS